jgi:enoyl-CoA hydratase
MSHGDDDCWRERVSVSLAESDGIATVTLDDGKVNALDGEVVARLREALAAARSAHAIVLAGRPGVLTAGLDVGRLTDMAAAERRELFADFGQLLLDLWIAPLPVVCAATGHAVAAGTLLALTSDHVVAAEGDYRWGLTEAQIGLELSDFSIALVRHRVPVEQVDRLLLQGVSVDPATAVRVGFAHETAPGSEVLDRAYVAARRLAGLPADAYARNKLRLRGASARVARERLGSDIAALVATDVIAESR